MDFSNHLLVFLILSTALPGWCQSVDDVANSLYVSYTLEGNYSPQPELYTASLSFRNIGETAITNGTWNIYFCSIRMLEPSVLPNATGYKLGSTGFTLFHVAGCLFRLQPNEDFTDIAPNNERVIRHVGAFWVAARTDVMPNFYVATPDGRTAPIPNTVDDMINFAAPLTLPRQYKRLEGDQYAPYTPQQRYDRYVADDLGQSPLRIIPKPRSMNISSDLTVQIDSSWVVFDNRGGTEDSFEATYLAEKLGISIIQSIEPTDTNVIVLNINDDVSTLPSCNGNDERYSVDVHADNVVITGAKMTGAFYGVQTLLATLSEENRIGQGNIRDCPRFRYRGFMVDVGRHFLPRDEILRILDVMAMYKLNKFHFHLSEDEGFRVEIKDLPELTTVGATQCHDLKGDDCIMPQLGSPPTKESSGSGYYSVEDYKDILQYAKNLHIQVIPEVDMPGHAHAIIKAMQSRNRTLDDPSYVVWDPDDTTQYLSAQLYSDNTINPCINTTYTFVETVVDAFIDMHRDIQPLEIFHWGGDEVEKAWLESPACAELAEDEPLIPSNFTYKDIKAYFVKRVQEILSDKGLDSAAWEDGVTDINGDPFPVPTTQRAYVNAWSNVWEWGNGGRAYEFANSGYQSIISHATHLYFDFPVEPDPEDRGYYWATRFTDSYKTFSYDASNIYKNIAYTTLGVELDPEIFCQNNSCPELERPQNIMGIQGHIWCETTRTPEHVHGNVFPRFLALAERAWHQADWENETDSSNRNQLIQQDWQGFANRVGYRELHRLDTLGIKYDIRPPAVLVENNNLKIKTEYPGLRVEVSTDWGASWVQYYPAMPVPRTDAIFVTKSADGTRRSRQVKYDAPQLPTPSPTSHACSVRASIFSVLTLTLALISFRL